MQKISRLSQPIDSELPLKRYFLCVGGALLTVLFAVDALMPRPANEIFASGPVLPRIRIHSEHKGPEAVIIDTNQRVVVPPVTAQAELQLTPQTFAPANARMRESFAQLVTPSQIKAGESKSKKEGGKLQTKRKVTRAHLKHQPVLVAQRQQFGFFDIRW
jgi:hypothetical protein